MLSLTYDCIKGADFASAEWERHIANSGKHDVTLRTDPGVDRLSRYEIFKLQDVAVKHEHLDDWALSELTHSFEEWLKNRPDAGRSRTIPIQDLLQAVGLGADADEILEGAREHRRVRAILDAA